MKECLL